VEARHQPGSSRPPRQVVRVQQVSTAGPAGVTARTWQSSSSRTWRELGSTSIRWNGYAGGPRSCRPPRTGVEDAEGEITSRQSGSAGRKPDPPQPPARRAQVDRLAPRCCARGNGNPRYSTRSAVTSPACGRRRRRRAVRAARPTMSRRHQSPRKACNRPPRTDGTIRRGAQISTARVGRRDRLPPARWNPLAVGSCPAAERWPFKLPALT